jgi:hypothetical protein
MHAGAGDTAAWAPVPDGVEFPLNATPMQLLSKGHVAPVPLLLGSNSDEGTGFMANDSSMTYALPLNTSGQEWIDWLGTAFVSRGIFGRSDAPQVHSGPLLRDACCVLRAACCVLCAACCMLCAVYCVLCFQVFSPPRTRQSLNYRINTYVLRTCHTHTDELASKAMSASARGAHVFEWATEAACPLCQVVAGFTGSRSRDSMLYW